MNEHENLSVVIHGISRIVFDVTAEAHGQVKFSHVERLITVWQNNLFYPETIAKELKRAYTPPLTCPPLRIKVSQAEMRQAIARVACLAFCPDQRSEPVFRLNQKQDKGNVCSTLA